MSFLKKSQKKIASTIFLTIFAGVALVGFIRPLFASELSGTKLILSKQTIDDPTQTFALLDSNFIEGGHMQVPTVNSMLGYPVDHIPGYSSTSTTIVYVTPERRKVGMLVTVLDPAGDGSASPATYRLIHNRDNTGTQLATTNRTWDGVSTASTYTQLGDWAVVIPSISSAQAAAGYIIVATSTASSTGYEFRLVPNTGGSGSGISAITSTGISGLFSFSASGSATSTLTFTLDSQPANYVFAGPTSATGTPSFRYLTPNDIYLGSGVHGILPTANGGLGGDFSTTTIGSILYADSVGHFLSLGIGTTGQILTVDCSSGTCVPAWQDQNGGIFSAAAGAVTQSNWTGVTGNTFGTATTTLSQFIQNVFFPALAPTLSLSGGGTFEWGSSASHTLSYLITKRTAANSVTGITLALNSGATMTLCTSNAGGNCPTADDSGSTSSFTIARNATMSGTSATGTQGTFNRTAVSASSQSTTVTTFTLSVGNLNTGTTTATTQFQYLPRVYYGISSDNLMDVGTYPDATATTSGTLNYKIQHLPTTSLQSTRVIAATNYTNNSTTTTKWVYFAWPRYQRPDSSFTGYEPDDELSYGTNGLDADLGQHGCKAVYGDGTGHNSYDDSGPGTACFKTGSDTSSVNPDSSFKHRTVKFFSNASGVAIYYELYQSEPFLSLTGPSTIAIQVQ